MNKKIKIGIISILLLMSFGCTKYVREDGKNVVYQEYETECKQTDVIDEKVTSVYTDGNSIYMFITESGNLISLRAEHPAKVYLPIEVTPSGIFTDFRLLHL